MADIESILNHPKFLAQRRRELVAPVRCIECRHTCAPPDALGVMACCALDGLPRITSIERECGEFDARAVS
jgi:hypothetical protein